MTLAKTSVFIASYNHARYLPQCLESIQMQTYQDFEIVVIDDGSTDASHEILLGYQKRYPDKIHYYWHDGHANKGVSATSNLAIQKSQGEYLAWIGSDDLWYPEKLEKQITLLKQNSSLGAVYSYADYIDGKGNALPGHAGADVTRDTNPVGRMLQFCHPPAMTLVFRRQCLDDVGVLDESLVYSDWDLMIRVFAHWKVGFINQPLAKYRIHNNNLSKKIDPKIDLNRILALYRHLEKRLPEIGGTLTQPRNQAILALQLAFHLFCDDQQAKAIVYLKSAFQKDPSLGDDVSFFNAWLNNWKPDFYTPEHNHFGLWVITHLPPTISPAFKSELLKLQIQNPETQSFFVRRGIQRAQSQSEPINMSHIFDDTLNECLPSSLKANVMRQVYSTLLFSSHQSKERTKTRYYWQKTIQSDRSWLGNLGVWSIGIQAFLGNWH